MERDKEILDSKFPRTQVFTIQERELESEENLFDVGFEKLYTTYYHVNKARVEKPYLE